MGSQRVRHDLVTQQQQDVIKNRWEDWSRERAKMSEKEGIAELISSVRFLKVGGGGIPRGGWQVLWWEEDEKWRRGREQHGLASRRTGRPPTTGPICSPQQEWCGIGGHGGQGRKEGSTSGGRGLPRWLSRKESACPCRRHRRYEFSPWVRKMPWRRKWQPTQVILPAESHGQRSLVRYSPWGCKDTDMTEGPSTHTCTLGRKE